MSGVRSTAAGHVDQNSSAHVARSFAAICEPAYVGYVGAAVAAHVVCSGRSRTEAIICD